MPTSAHRLRRPVPHPPQPNWKAAIGDVKCAIGWVKQHALTPEWNVDPERLALLGRSAGGHLALMAAYAPEDPELLPSCDAGDTGVDAVARFTRQPICPGAKQSGEPADLGQPRHAARLRGRNARLRDRALPGALADRARHAGAPRTLLAHGGRDQFVPHGHMGLLGARLRAIGVPCETIFIPYGQHAFDFVVGSLSSQLLEAALLDFLRR